MSDCTEACWDEHDPKTCECQVKDCPCFYFEADEPEPEEVQGP